ncbi:CmpA/NrtA family ABC transporter substrate-binding protein [Parahaliea mediterranea]|uniref:ABC transporter substrate-binding protein n=1 Tax=Parahaliea mediterranea TaxID=651086 RepID=A0A939DF48_9GAMM|nr:CmpA/NrtA family ABC transporter substrate-binding protein [Parahaliea mediterranea]MBN7796736.1 ABC transporter substrate-binding protein [Parahaliea mediterranea]
MIDVARQPVAEKRDLSLGYLRLTDSAPLAVARELGLYERYGLSVRLEREVSWANLRDKLVVGQLDAAQMLAPLPFATSLGAGGMRADVITGLALSLNGNAITVSQRLAEVLAARDGDPREGALSTAAALGRHIRESAGSGTTLTFAAAHTFSCHIFQLRQWLRAGGVDPDRDVHVIVLPPEQMVDSLARGIIDGYCVGEPWNTVAVQRGIGQVQATGYAIWNNAVEKVLGVTQQWHQRYPAAHLRLRLALMEACAWLSLPDNRLRAASILADPHYLDMPEELLRPSLAGELVFARGQAPLSLPDFHVFGRYQAGFPWRSDGEWLVQQTSELLGKHMGEERIKSLIQRTLRTDLYRECARYLNLPCPERDYRPSNTHRGVWQFEPGIELGADYRL